MLHLGVTTVDKGLCKLIDRGHLQTHPPLPLPSQALSIMCLYSLSLCACNIIDRYVIEVVVVVVDICVKLLGWVGKECWRGRGIQVAKTDTL